MRQGDSTMTFQKMMRLGAVLLAMMIAAPALAEEYTAIVTAGKLSVYADEAQSWLLGTIPAATVVTVESAENDTAKIVCAGQTGYASAAGLTALDSLATGVVVNTQSRVYQSPSLSSRWVSLPEGMELNLLAVNGKWAMVENNGVVAYTNRDHLTQKAQQTPETSETETEAPEVTVETFEAKVTADSMRVYRKASTSSKYLGSVSKDTVVTVHAYCNGWAYIELNGNKGFAEISAMTRATKEEEKADEAFSADALLEKGYTVEQIIYAFLVKEMKLNTAAACGILANVDRECSFRVTAASYDGGYGICQWTGTRNTLLKNWCSENGYDASTLEGQLRFLQYELENTRTNTLKYLKNVENSAAGAYDAAYYFCYNFEIPANRAARSVERGNLAKDQYWRTYAA